MYTKKTVPYGTVFYSKLCFQQAEAIRRIASVQSGIVLRLNGKIEPAACRGGGYPLCCYMMLMILTDTVRSIENTNFPIQFSALYN